MTSSAASKMMRTGRPTVFYAVVLGALAAMVLAAAGTRPAEAAFPGKNGKIAFTSFRDGSYEIYRMSGGGGSQTKLAQNSAIDRESSWQPLP